MNETWQFIKSILTHQTVQLIIALGGLAVILVNMWLAAHIAPLASNLNTVTTEVAADNTRLANDEKYIPQFIQMQQQVVDEQSSLTRIENKVDSIDSFLRGYK